MAACAKRQSLDDASLHGQAMHDDADGYEDGNQPGKHGPILVLKVAGVN